MTDKQRAAYEWAKAHTDYRSVAARYAQELAGLVDDLMEQKLESNLKALESGGWISVEERLPDEEGLYLTWDKAPSYGISWFDMRSLSKYTWQHEITHWMPLPEPPKED